jgi:TAG lipase / steryl ester hydrolase / phospholipase A2 / LPA acyltransferase
MKGIRKLEKAIDRAESYEEWKDAAHAYDKASGMDRWRAKSASSHYDNDSIRIRLDSLQFQRARHDYRGLLFTLNEGIHGNMGGMGRSSLYEKAMSGTKNLVTEYVNEIIEALELLASPEVDDISFEEKLDFFRRAHHCFGRSAFMMSGSGTLLYFHIGVVKALFEQGLLPTIMSGASGGSIVGSLLCTHTDDQLREMLTPEYLAQEVATESPLAGALTGFWPKPLKVEEVESQISRLIPDMTFQESFDHTGRMLNISIAAVEKHQTSRLLNATTSPNLLIRKSIMASSAVPGLFPAVTLETRDKFGDVQPYLPSRKWVDGSVSDDLPTKRLARLYGVNHYIVSQANPAVLPFIMGSKHQNTPLDILRSTARNTNREWLNAVAAIMHKPLSKDNALSQFANTLISVVNQDYVGDINILPKNRFHNPLKIMSHLSLKEVTTLVTSGERSAWRKIEMIRVQTGISSALDKILLDYEAQSAASHHSSKGARKA